MAWNQAGRRQSSSLAADGLAGTPPPPRNPDGAFPHHLHRQPERPYPSPGGGTGTDLYIKAEVFRDAFAGDLPRKTTSLMQAEQRPFSVAAFTEPSGDPAWKTIPSWYLVATNDHAIPPATQKFMAHRAGSTISHVAASRVPMQSQPKATQAVIMAAIRAVD